ncbi:MAG: formate dehydrogenase accessory sulfurtransferase FdhD [Candidatus Bathyarchaeia archaeon]
MSIRRVIIHRLDLGKGCTSLEDEVAADEAMCIFVNDEYYRTLIASPTMRRELVVGHLITEGVIESVEDILKMDETPFKVRVETRRQVDLDMMIRLRRDLILTSCGASPTPGGEQIEHLKVNSEARFEAATILQKVKELFNLGETFRRTGGTHSAMICTPEGETVAFAEDVGRHNAVDKVIGSALLERYSTKDCFLTSSGRISSDIVLKVARVGMPLIASIAGPLESGIRAAEATGITLICFARGKRMNIYTNPNRVIFNNQ